jgi:enoyl-CoA hydratase/carnithine racemase
MERFIERIDEVKEDPELRSLIITSHGKHFCAGAELSGGTVGSPSSVGGPAGIANRLRHIYTPFLALLDLPIPTVAAVNGAAVGGGLGLALVCDFRIVTPRSRMMAPFAKLGFHPGMALTYLLPRLVGLPRAMEMLLCGSDVFGEQALQWGLANRCVAEESLMEEAAVFAGQLAAGSPAVVQWTKRSIHRAIELDARAAADVESLAQALTISSDDAKEGLRAFLEKRNPEFTGS